MRSNLLIKVESRPEFSIKEKLGSYFCPGKIGLQAAKTDALA